MIWCKFKPRFQKATGISNQVLVGEGTALSPQEYEMLVDVEWNKLETVFVYTYRFIQNFWCVIHCYSFVKSSSNNKKGH